ncbi:hypothetical protein Poly24_17040 [Rosistilla carotiformis]|uniref:Uncharacterized protein n=1 Tax=Rosistilla carotiformis TaxID=2528017 RepID=A0A518JR35_9BACT|nr:hypothetical protein [Rosistilla carotiformis]QDV67998.1 hypothetical protein Poly24_17040 [Rosistilla carotiformis]
MNDTEHKACYGNIFPRHIGSGDPVGKVFSIRTEPSSGMIRTKPRVETDVKQWDACRKCPEFESCYQLSMASIAMETAVASHY